MRRSAVPLTCLVGTVTGAAVPQLAQDCVLLVRGQDAVVLRRGMEILYLPGAGQACGWFAHSPLAAVHDWREHAPAPVRQLVATLEEYGVIETSPLTEHLLALHAQTVAGPFQRPTDEGADTEFLIREYGRPGIALPPADLGAASLAAVLRTRRSTPPLGSRNLSLGDLGTLLESAVGRTDDGDAIPPGPMGPRRAYPSGGALYLVETHLVVLKIDAVPPATYRYHPVTHSLSQRAPASTATDIATWVPDLSGGDAAVVVLLTVDLGRPSLSRYGGKAYRLALLESGHIAQNLLLVGAALDLRGLPLCGFHADEVPALAGLGPAEVAVYALGFGSGVDTDPTSRDRR